MIYKSIDLHPYLGVGSKPGGEKSPRDLLWNSAHYFKSSPESLSRLAVNWYNWCCVRFGKVCWSEFQVVQLKVNSLSGGNKPCFLFSPFCLLRRATWFHWWGQTSVFVEVISLLRTLQIVSLCRWQRAVRSSLHIKQMYGETQHWRDASDLSHQAVWYGGDKQGHAARVSVVKH